MNIGLETRRMSCCLAEAEDWTVFRMREAL